MHDVNRVYKRNGVGQPWLNVIVISPKASLHTNRVCWNCGETEQQCEESGHNPDAGDHTQKESKRFNGKMFGNVGPGHKSDVIDSKLSPKRKLSLRGEHAPRMLAMAPSPSRACGRIRFGSSAC